MADQGRDELQQQRNRQRQRQEGQIDDGRVPADQVHLEQFQADAGIEDDAPEGVMDIDADAGNEKENPHDGDDLRHMRLMAAVPPKEGPSDDVKADEDDGDQQVDQDHRPKRI